jgi:hypothetical protein
VAHQLLRRSGGAIDGTGPSHIHGNPPGSIHLSFACNLPCDPCIHVEERMSELLELVVSRVLG